MIYISTSCIKTSSLTDTIKTLAKEGIKNIELSGGSNYYKDLEKDLLLLKDKYDLSYLCHNYFPPPKSHFILNLASLDDEIYTKSINHLIKSIELSKKLGAKKFGFHAGYFINIKIEEIGKNITYSKKYNNELSLKRFCEGFNLLNQKAKSLDVELYIENNVYSNSNFKTYNGENIFMLTSFLDYISLKKEIDFKILLDVAHLKVSSNTLNLDFKEQWKELFSETDYIHLSDNDGFSDQNRGLTSDSQITKLLLNSDIKNKVFTLEIYDKMETILSSIDILKGIIDARKIN